MSERDQNVAKQLLSTVRRDKATGMRAAGYNWREVADACGYSSPAAALKDVGAALKEATQRADASADELLDGTLLRLEGLLRAAIEMIEPETFYGEKGQELDDRPARLKGVEAARKLVMDMAKLQGVDRPVEEKSTEQTIRIIGLDPSDIV